MKTYWSQLNDRERWMVGLGLGLSLCYLIYLLLLAPFFKAIHEQSKQLIEKQETLAWMEQVSHQYQAKQAPQRLTSPKLLTAVADLLNKSSFKRFPYQLQQTGAEDIQLIYDKVPYQAFISWLWSMNERYAFSIKQLTLSRTELPGVVKLILVISVHQV